MSAYLTRMNIPNPPKPSKVTPGTLRRLAELFAALGLTDHADALNRAVDQVAAIAADHQSAAAALEATRQDTAKGVADGTLGVAEAAAAVNEAERSTPNTATHDEVVSRARRNVTRDATAYLTGRGDQLVAELDTIVAAAGDTIASNAEKVAGVGTDAEAIRASGATAKAWQAITASIDTIETAWQLAAALRFARMVSTLPAPVPAPVYWQWHHPDRLPRLPHDTARYVEAITNGAGAACLNAGQVVEEHVDTGGDAA